jgi:hypothetical protein
LYHFGFRRQVWARSRFRLVCGLDYTFTLARSRFRCCSSSLYTFAAVVRPLRLAQSPIPLDGTMVKWSWFKFYRDPPQRMSSDRVVQSWDTASKAEEINDYSVGTTWLVKQNDYYLLDLVRARDTIPLAQASGQRGHPRGAAASQR